MLHWGCSSVARKTAQSVNKLKVWDILEGLFWGTHLDLLVRANVPMQLRFAGSSGASFALGQLALMQPGTRSAFRSNAF